MNGSLSRWLFPIRFVFAGLLLSVTTLHSFASSAADAADKAAVIGQPVALQVQPERITLRGRHANQQLVVTGRYADGLVRDLTGLCALSSEAAEVAAVDDTGFITPKKNGQTAILIKAGGKSARVPVTVTDLDKPHATSFRTEVIAALNVGGCNAGACHGTPSGKNGFKLSLRGFDPAADYLQLTRDVLGRRTDRQQPDASLILQKGLGRVPHEGGQRFLPDSVPVRALRDWLAEGLRDDPPNPVSVMSIDILPGSRVQRAPARWQQLAVLGHFSDGSERDVTRLTVFSSSDPAVADVSSSGLVSFKQTGEVAILCRYLMELQTIRLTYLEPREGFVWPNPPENNYIDKHVFAKLKMLSIPPSEPCTDQEFIRRAYLDVCGRLPEPKEVREFLSDNALNKRAKLIDALLERPEYADFWTLKWSDVFRSSRKAVQIKGTHVFQHWLRDHIAKNSGFDTVVRELLTASGSTFANPPANYYRVARDPQNLAETTAQLFFGIRMQCAKCHNHPFERWTQDDYYSMAAFFARVRHKNDPLELGTDPQKKTGAEIIYDGRSGEVTQPRTGQVMKPKFMGGDVPSIPARADRRQVLADWLTRGDNPFFAKSVVNRIWFHLNGKGIVDPVDDFRDSNPSANDELLDALAKDFVAHKFDSKHLIRVIMNSRTYQLSAQTNEFNADDNKYFSHAVTKLLTAEQLLDAICSVIEVPEKFAGQPLGTRAVQLPDGDASNTFLKTFGQPARELACECERESDSNLAQALQLINGPTINEKVRNANNRIGRLLKAKTSELEMLNELYLSTLSRLPNQENVKVALEHVAKAQDKRKAWEDIQWALLNAKEFLFRH
ncbi:MAG TPA: DUF1553 domain-containing protein [Gemmataceae bacterium]|nr:DUF1553 domain-containing protein [Gemmataceae bacterium]